MNGNALEVLLGICEKKNGNLFIKETDAINFFTEYPTFRNVVIKILENKEFRDVISNPKVVASLKSVNIEIFEEKRKSMQQSNLKREYCDSLEITIRNLLENQDITENEKTHVSTYLRAFLKTFKNSDDAYLGGGGTTACVVLGMGWSTIGIVTGGICISTGWATLGTSCIVFLVWAGFTLFGVAGVVGAKAMGGSRIPYEKRKKDELVRIAKAKGIDVRKMTKSTIITMLRMKK